MGVEDEDDDDDDDKITTAESREQRVESRE
jgi:hypothetical protein